MTNYHTIERKINEVLSNACVESFGVSHQIPFTTFRNDSGEDYTLYIESKAYWNLSPNSGDFLSDFLLGAIKANLKKVHSVQLFNNNDLILSIESSFKLTIKGTDECPNIYEPWSLNNERSVDDPAMLKIIALNGGEITGWY